DDLHADPPVGGVGQEQPAALRSTLEILEVVEHVPPADPLLLDLPYPAGPTAGEVLPRGDARQVEVAEGGRQLVAVGVLRPLLLRGEVPGELPVHQRGDLLIGLPLLL